MNIREVRPMLPPDTIYDERYKTANNIAKKALHVAEFEPQLAEPAAEALAEMAWQKLYASSLRLVWFDGLRTEEAHAALLAAESNPKFVKPAGETKHTKGLAVDITVAQQNGNYLDIGCEFDEFDKSEFGREGLDDNQRYNQEFIRGLMVEYGFVAYNPECFHYEWPDTNPTD